MAADITKKTDQYEQLLAEALEAAQSTPAKGSPLADAAAEFADMASSYLEDGRHFAAEGDRVNALAAYAYGHAWLDAGARLGLFEIPEDDHLFAV